MSCTEELDHVCSFYKDDFQRETLRAQLLTFGIEFQRVRSETYDETIKPPTIFDIKNVFTALSIAQRSLLSEVSKIIQLILVMPATNATSERSFSALRRVKNYLRSTMTQQRLKINNLMVLHLHIDITNQIELKAVATEFVADSEHRLNIFGKFK